jgi:ACT domain-containing protein
MRSIKLSIRTNQALEVIQLSLEGMSIVEACKEVRIPRSTFYHFVTTHPDAIANFQELQIAAGLQQLALLLENQTKVLERVIEEGLADTTKPRDRLAILKAITKLVDELQEDLHVNRRDGKDAADFLTGPKLEPAASRFSASETTINLP